MNTADIIRYCQLLPPFARRFDVCAEEVGSGSNHQARLVRTHNALSDPRFGWLYVKTLVECNTAPPLGIANTWLLRAYMFEKGRGRDPILEKVILMGTTPKIHFQYAIQALLIHKDFSFTKIAKRLGLDVAVVEAYEQLFFNVRDRMDDQAYMQNIIWPDGRYVEQNPNYQQENSFRQRLLQTSYEHGPDKALAAGGFTQHWGPLTGGAAALQETLRITLAGANISLWGSTGGNSNARPVRSSLGILTAQAQSGAPSESVTAQTGIQNLGDWMLKELDDLTSAGRVIDVVATVIPQGLPSPSKLD